MLYARNGWELEVPSIDRSTGALGHQHNKGRDRAARLKQFHDEAIAKAAKERGEKATILGTLTVRQINYETFSFKPIDPKLLEPESSAETFVIVRGAADILHDEISCQSPFGQAFLYMREKVHEVVGAILRVFSENGVILKFEILSVNGEV